MKFTLYYPIAKIILNLKFSVIITKGGFEKAEAVFIFFEFYGIRDRINIKMMNDIAQVLISRPSTSWASSIRW